MAFRTVLAVLVGASLFFITPAAAREARVDISIVETASGVRIVYDLPSAVREFAIGGTEGAPPTDGLRLAEPGLSWREGRIVGRAPFRRATLLIGPDTREEDARYPLLSPVAGRGSVLFAPYVLPSSGVWHLRVSTGGSRQRHVPREEARLGFLPIGIEPVIAGRIRALQGENISPEALAGIHRRVYALLDFYTARLGRGPGDPPLIVITNDPTPSGGIATGFRGDVTPNGVILLRFRGPMPDGTDPASRGRATGFLAHELFHLWNGRRGDHPRNEAWLHEGSADYYSWLAVAALWPEEIAVERNLQNALNICMAFLGSRPLTATTGERAGLRYPCGAVAHWIADVGARGASHGRVTGFDLWARLISADPAQGDYSLAGFRATVTDLAAPLAPLLDDFIDRGLGWEGLAPALTARGADVSFGPPSPHALRFATARPIALSLCTGFSGAGHHESGAFFTGDCGELGEQVYLVRIGGHDPVEEPQAVFDQVRNACGAGGELDVVLRSGETIHERRIHCSVAVDPPVPDMVIRRALPLSPPARSGP